MRRPKVEDQQLANMLSGLGQSRISSNLNQLAKSINISALDVDQDIEQQLQDACAVLAMRKALITALGIKTEQ